MSQAASLPMKWHNFIVKVGLILSVLGSIITAILFGSGTIYETMGLNAAYVYRSFGSLQMLDILYAVATLMCGVYAWQTRSALKDFRRGAPSMLLTLYGMNIGVTLLYNIAAILLLHSNLSDLSSLSTSVISCIAAIALNRVYYQKRAHLFTH